MSVILTVTLPLFVLILAGYLSAWRGLIDDPGIRGLTRFVFFFALPLTLFHSLANAPVATDFDGRYVLVYFGCALAIHLSGLAAARWIFGCKLAEQSVHALAGSFGNTVFIGLTLVTEIYGEAAALPIALLVAIENALVIPLTIGLIEIERAGRGALWKAPAAAAAALVKSPVVMSVMAGMAVAFAGIELPLLLDGIVGVLRGANVPCALFALGATLAGLPLSERVRETGSMIALKLFAYPLLVWLAMGLVPGLDPVWRNVAVIAAAMPMGANVYLVAARYGVYVARASSAVLFSTMLSLLTISLLVVTLTGG